MGTLSILLPTGLVSLSPNLRSSNASSDEGWVNYANDGTTDQDLIDGLGGGSGGILGYALAQAVTRDLTIVFAWNDPDAEIFILDGAPAVKLSDLPQGFAMRGALTISVQAIGVGASPMFTATQGQSITGPGSLQVSGYYQYDDLVSPGLPLAPGDAYVTADDFMSSELTFAVTGINSGDFVFPFGPGIIFADGGTAPFAIVGDFITSTPTPTTINPSTGPVAGGTTVTISGSGFNATTGVTFDGLSAAFTIVSDTKLTAISPAHAVGPVTVTVVGVGVTASFTYLLVKAVLPPLPTLR